MVDAHAFPSQNFQRPLPRGSRKSQSKVKKVRVESISALRTITKKDKSDNNHKLKKSRSLKPLTEQAPSSDGEFGRNWNKEELSIRKTAFLGFQSVYETLPSKKGTVHFTRSPANLTKGKLRPIKQIRRRRLWCHCDT